MERVLKHKYSVGETVYFTASNVARPAASGTYEVIRLLPTDGDDCQYRIKSSTEAFERVAKESQLGGFLNDLYAGSRLARFRKGRRQKAPFAEPFSRKLNGAKAHSLSPVAFDAA